MTLEGRTRQGRGLHWSSADESIRDGRRARQFWRATKALATLDREWAGLIAHRDYPMIGLDNNRAERAIRGPVVTRKNARGSHNDDSARLAATVWTVTATAQMAGLNVLTWLTAYLDACGLNNGKPLTGPERRVLQSGSCPSTSCAHSLPAMLGPT